MRDLFEPTAPSSPPREIIAVARLSHGDPARTLVMKRFGQLVAGGFARWEMFDEGDIRLRLDTGETFLLAEKAIIRIA